MVYVVLDDILAACHYYHSFSKIGMLSHFAVMTSLSNLFDRNLKPWTKFHIDTTFSSGVF